MAVIYVGFEFGGMGTSTGKIALPDHLPVVTILSINETAHRVLQALFIFD